MSYLHFEKIDDYRHRIARRGKMNAPGLIYASDAMLAEIRKDKSPEQVANVAHLPGIVERVDRDARHALGIRIPDRRGRRVR